MYFNGEFLHVVFKYIGECINLENEHNGHVYPCEIEQRSFAFEWIPINVVNYTLSNH